MADKKNTNPIKNNVVSMEGITLRPLNEGLNFKVRVSPQKGDSHPPKPQPPSAVK
ncbi:hypothetical protein L4F91_02665 [Avibacterium sp. 20-126]|uniref:hypothetical protein n=1 Tax=Avibacterium sp. 20-126 TaxID=2911524 RepID=UPI00218B4C2F|nr:hypothetical protein L4F91_02665 [Avibacterium sp. 20-126]